MMSVRRQVRVAALAGVLVLAACATPDPIPADHFYRISTDVGVGPCCAGSLPSLVVSDFRADGIYADRPVIVVSAAGTELTQRRYDFWMDSPGRMLAHALAAYLEAGADGASVLPTAAARQAMLRIEGRIDHFELVEAGDDSYRPRLGIEFVVKDADGRVRFTQRFEEIGDPMPIRDALAGRGFSAVTVSVFSGFVEALAANAAAGG